MTDSADLRFRLDRGDGLCLNEHTVNSGGEPDEFEFWITCGDETLTRVKFPPQMMATADTDLVATWMALAMERHRARTAERIVGELLDQLDRGSKGHD